MAIQLAPTSEYKMTYQEAVMYCAFCTHDDYNDWRIPVKSDFNSLNDKPIGWYMEINSTYKWRVTPVRDVC